MSKLYDTIMKNTRSHCVHNNWAAWRAQRKGKKNDYKQTVCISHLNNLIRCAMCVVWSNVVEALFSLPFQQVFFVCLDLHFVHFEPFRMVGWTKQVLRFCANLETVKMESSIPWTAATLGNSLPAFFVLWTHVCNPCQSRRRRRRKKRTS